jgi:hypothetical protein
MPGSFKPPSSGNSNSTGCAQQHAKINAGPSAAAEAPDVDGNQLRAVHTCVHELGTPAATLQLQETAGHLSNFQQTVLTSGKINTQVIQLTLAAADATTLPHRFKGQLGGMLPDKQVTTV